MPTDTPSYVVIERQHSRDLAVTYPSEALADKAVTDSPLIDAFCEEDALDCYSSSNIPDGAEVIIAGDVDIAAILKKGK
jgi:hypothetical protein